MNLSEIFVIGFDLDGTLYPLTPEIQKRIRKKIYENISFHFSIAFEQAREMFEREYERLSSGSKTIEELEKQLGKKLNYPDFIQDAIEQADILDLIQKNQALQEMLFRLSKTKTLDLLTGSTYPLTLRKLKRIGINPEIFEYILAHKDGSKSSGDLYEKWLRTREFPPESFLYIGDNKKLDIEVPKSLGIITCIIGNSDSADFQISNILDLESLL